MYELGTLFFYRPIFMSELLLAEMLFLFPLKKRNGLAWRLPLALAICYGVSFALPTLSNTFYQMGMFITMFLTTYAVAFLVFNVKWNSTLFCCIAAYNLQHCSYCLYDLLLCVFGLGHGAGSFYNPDSTSLFSGPLQALSYAGSYLLCYWLAYFFFASRIKKNSDIHIRSLGMFSLSIICLFSDILINSFVIAWANGFSTQSLIFIDSLSILLCTIAMALQFELATRHRLDDDVSFLKYARKREKEQYYAHKENVELINMKVHDLKHQIRDLGQKNAIPPEFIEDVNKTISIYESSVKTGNDTIDFVLTEKSLLCLKEGIRLTCIVDGAALSFLAETDVYSLFGNMIDNAIEAVKALPAEEKVISLKVQKKSNFVTIHESNRFDGRDLKFSQGLPKTSKKDKNNHGFGMKNIKYVTEKYDGNLSVTVENGIFSLSILFPVQNN